MASSESSPLERGDSVRFERYGEWLQGTVVHVERGMVCIEYGRHGATTWRWLDSRNVTPATASIAGADPKETP